MTLRRYFHKPKGQLILVLGALAVVAAIGPDWKGALATLAVASVAAVAVDAPILRFRKGHWVAPDGALLTGMIIGMVLARQVPLHVVALTSAIAILAKHFFRTQHANVFNPAAIALLCTYYVYRPAQDWWGSAPDGGALQLILLAAGGIFITQRVHKFPLLVSFLGVYFLLFSAAAYFADPMVVVGVFRGADLRAVLFFAFFMATDPPTSPPRARDQVIFGIIAAAGSFAVRETVGAVYFIISGLVIANIWEAQRRVRAHTIWKKHHSATA